MPERHVLNNRLLKYFLCASLKEIEKANLPSLPERYKDVLHLRGYCTPGPYF